MTPSHSIRSPAFRFSLGIESADFDFDSVFPATQFNPAPMPTWEFDEDSSLYSVTVRSDAPHCFMIQEDTRVFAIDAETRDAVEFTLYDVATYGLLGNVSILDTSVMLSDYSIGCAVIPGATLSNPSFLFSMGDYIGTNAQSVYANDWYNTVIDLADAVSGNDFFVYGQSGAVYGTLDWFTTSLEVITFPSQKSMTIIPINSGDDNHPDMTGRLSSGLIGIIPAEFWSGESRIWIRQVLNGESHEDIDEYAFLFVTQFVTDIFNERGEALVELPAFVCTDSEIGSYAGRFYWSVSAQGKDATVDGVYLALSNVSVFDAVYPTPESTKFASSGSIQLTEDEWTYYHIGFCASVTGTGVARVKLNAYNFEFHGTASATAPLIDPSYEAFAPWDLPAFARVPAGDDSFDASSAASVSTVAVAVVAALAALL